LFFVLIVEGAKVRILSNYTYKQSFGYDKKLNAELKSELSVHSDKPWARTISSLNSFCNTTENNIKKAEKDSNDSRYQDYLDIFLTAKQMLAGFVEITFENLHFADREYRHYDDEFKKNGSKENDWRKEVCNSLSDWTSAAVAPVKRIEKTSDATKEKDTSSIESVTDKNKPETSLKSDSAKLPQSSSGLSKKSFLEEFKKDAFSPNGFSDVAGMADLKRTLNETIIQFVNNPEQAKLDFEEYGKTIPKGILLYGPPGCGKTYITQALASELASPVYLLNISNAGSHYINMTAKNIKAAFDEIISISEKTEKPCVLFMDEIDSLCFDRNSRMEPDDLKQVATILQALDKAKKSNVIIIGATNKYNLLDPAVRRRFDSKVFVDIPDVESIKALLKKNLTPIKKGQNLLSSENELDTIAKMLYGYSNSSICNISKEAALNAMRRDRADVSVQDYQKAIENTTEEKPDRKLYKADSATTARKIGF